MFEKEAKERAKDYTDNAKRQVAYECGFLDGVDFVGYNKAEDVNHELMIKLKDEKNRKLKLLVKALLYEINQIWDINEMDPDVREAAEQIEKED